MIRVSPEKIKLFDTNLDGIIDSTGEAEKKFIINFSKANTKLCLSLHYHGDGSYLYVNKTEI